MYIDIIHSSYHFIFLFSYFSSVIQLWITHALHHRIRPAKRPIVVIAPIASMGPIDPWLKPLRRSLPRRLQRTPPWIMIRANRLKRVKLRRSRRVREGMMTSCCWGSTDPPRRLRRYARLIGYHPSVRLRIQVRERRGRCSAPSHRHPHLRLVFIGLAQLLLLLPGIFKLLFSFLVILILCYSHCSRDDPRGSRRSPNSESCRRASSTPVRQL